MKTIGHIGLFIGIGVGFASSAHARTVGWVSLTGPAPAPVRAAAEKTILETLQGLEEFEVVLLNQASAVLGQDGVRTLAACGRNPACLRKASRRIRLDDILTGTLDEDASLRLLLVATATQTTAKVTTVLPDDRRRWAGTISQTILELFPDWADRAFGTLVVRSGPLGASVAVDGDTRGQLALSPTADEPRFVLRLPVGDHRLRLTSPGHFGRTTNVSIHVGQTIEIDLELTKNRSQGPVILGALGVLAAGGAVLAGLSTEARISPWTDGCVGGASCRPGLTQDRYLADQDTVQGGRWVTIGLASSATLALVSSLVWYLLDPGQPVASP